MNKAQRIFILAGEASGDLHASNLVKAVRAANPNVVFEGLGGGRMADAGVDILRNIVDDLAIVGFIDVLQHLPTLRSLMRMVVERLETTRPDAVLLVDYPGFNLRVAKQAKKLGLRVIYYICPQTWAWHESRAKAFPKILDHMLTIFPFEEDLFRSYGAQATFVGHPLLDLMNVTMDRRETCEQLGLDANRPILCLLPGSRRSEVQGLLPVMLEAAIQLKALMPDMQYVLPKAETIQRQMIEEIAQPFGVHLLIAEKERHNLRACSDFAWVASGTATLETALLGIPMVILYRAHYLTYALGKRLVKLSHIGLPNIVVGREIVPELLQDEAHAEQLCGKTAEILNDANRLQSMKNNLKQVREKLHSPNNNHSDKTSYQRAAEVLLAQIM